MYKKNENDSVQRKTTNKNENDHAQTKSDNQKKEISDFVTDFGILFRANFYFGNILGRDTV